jgi:N-methylhydantoinase B
MLVAMADAVGEDAIAGDVGSPNLHTAQGFHADGRMWIAVGVGGGESGPWGATRAGDADSFSKFYQANSIDTAVEASEADSPIVILRREYVTDTGGAGFNRGGAGVLKDTLYLEAARHSVITLRFKQASGRGVRGGRMVCRRRVWDEPDAASAARHGSRRYRRHHVAGRLDGAAARLRRWRLLLVRPEAQRPGPGAAAT